MRNAIRILYNGVNREDVKAKPEPLDFSTMYRDKTARPDQKVSTPKVVKL
jgi:hypothetical protein